MIRALAPGNCRRGHRRHASDAEVKALIDSGIRFSDLWEVASADAVKADPGRFAGFRPLQVYPGNGGKAELEYSHRQRPAPGAADLGQCPDAIKAAKRAIALRTTTGTPVPSDSVSA